ncbi:MAG: Rrf2 family transcriptional regulator [Saprospiraceae bacterium]|nr:Rrf2 family transcriptional regulator [Saprospiraceae bacterium]
MLTSKTFGYAVRGLLYLSKEASHDKYIQMDVIAQRIHAPKHFLAKIFKKLADAQWIDSIKGPNGGFKSNENTLNASLLELLLLTDPNDPLDHCVLKWEKCNSKRPCPFHVHIDPIKSQFIKVLKQTRIIDLLDVNIRNKHSFLKDI